MLASAVTIAVVTHSERAMSLCFIHRPIPDNVFDSWNANIGLETKGRDVI